MKIGGSMYLNLNLVLRVLTATLLISLAYFSYHYKFGSCDLCDFKINGTSYTTSQLIAEVTERCLQSPFDQEYRDLQLTFLNLSQKIEDNAQS